MLVTLLGFEVIFYLITDVFDKSVDEFEAVEFSFEGCLSALVEGFFEDEAGLLALEFLAIRALEFLYFGDGFVDEDETALKLLHAGDFLSSLCTHCLHYLGVLEQFFPTDAFFRLLA